MENVREWVRHRVWVAGGAGLMLGALVAGASGTLGGAIGLVVGPKSAPSATPASFYEVTVDGIPFTNTDFVGVSSISSATIGDRTSYQPVKILRRYAGSDELRAWWERVSAGRMPEPRNVKITYYDAALRPFETVVLEQAWPSGWETAPMDVKTQEPGVESIRLTFLRTENR